MSIDKQLMRLEIAYDLISSVHNYVCVTPNSRGTGLPEMGLEVLRNLILFSEGLEKQKDGADNE